ncbi:MAG: translocation/assembly module TamB domain-containing protein [Desulfobacterales bacterium]|nr:translocation/assembly module TamB domain-containing protein [Desulfobacterales bacterium]
MKTEEVSNSDPALESRQIKKRPLRNSLSRFLLYSAATVSVILMAAYLLFQTDMAQAWARNFLKRAIEDSLPVQIQIGKISGNPFLGLSLEQVRISQKDKPLFSAHQIKLNYILPMLLSKVIYVTELQIDQMDLRLNRAPEGDWNLNALFAPGEGINTGPAPFPFKITVSRLTFTGGALVIADSRNRTAPVRHFNDINLTAGMEIKPDASVNARIIMFSFNTDLPGIRLKAVTARLNYQPGSRRLNVLDSRMQTTASDVRLSGKLQMDPAGPEFDLRLSMKALSLAEIGRVLAAAELESGILSGSLSVSGRPDRFQHALDLHLAGTSFSTRGTVSVTQDNRFGLDLKGTLGHFNPGALPLPGHLKINADINSDFVIRGVELNRPERKGQLTVNFRPSRLGGYTLSEGDIHAAIDREWITLTRSRLVTSLGRMEIVGAKTDLLSTSSPGTLSLEALFRNLDLAALTGRRGQGNVNMDVTASAALPAPRSGKPDFSNATIRMSAGIHPSRAFHMDIQSGRVKATWDKGQIRLGQLELFTGSGRLGLSGSILPEGPFATLRFDLALPALDRTVLLLKQLAPDIIKKHPDLKSLSGSLKVSGQFDGGWNHPLISADIIATGLNYGRFFADSLNMETRLKGGWKNFTSSVATHIKNFKIGSTLLPTVSVHADLSPDSLRTRLTLRHQTGADLTLSGSLDRWNQPVRDITIETLKFTLPRICPGRDLPHDLLENRGPIRMTMSQGAFHVSTLELISGAASLSLSGSLAPSGNLKSDILLRGLNLSRIFCVRPGMKTINGQVSARITASGALSRPVLQAKITLKNGSGYNFSLPELNLSMDYDQEQVRLEAGGFDGKNKILDLHARAGLLLTLSPFRFQALATPFEMSLQSQGLTVADLPISHKGGMKLDGTIQLSASASGTLDAPAADAQLSIKNIFWSPGKDVWPDVSLAALNLNLRYERSELKIDAALFDQHQKLFDATGRSGFRLSLLPWHLNPIGDLDLEVNARDVKLAALPIPRRPGLDYDGLLNLHLKAAGKLNQPAVTGHLVLKNARLSLTDPRVSFETVTAEMAFTPQSISVKQIQLKSSRHGLLNISGLIDLPPAKPAALALRLTGKNMAIPLPPGVFIRTQPDLMLSGTPALPVLTGKLAVSESRVNLDLLHGQQPAEIQVDAAPGSEQTVQVELTQKSTPWEQYTSSLHADIDIDIPKNAWLKGQGINTEISGRIGVKKSPFKPFTFAGPLKTLRGSYSFQGKIFRITRGLVDFIGLEEPNPNLDMEAETRIKDVTIKVKISGTARNVVLTLDSDPPMERSEIISYLIFGQPSTALKRQQGFSAETSALNLTGRMVLAELNTILGDARILDTLTVETNGKDISQGTIAVGKYIHPDVFVLYRHRLKVDETDRVEVIYEINRNYSIETQIGDERSSGIDLLWEYDF